MNSRTVSYTHLDLDKRQAIVCPGAHLGRVILVDQSAPDEGGEDTGSHTRLHVGERRRVKFEGSMEADARCLVRGDGPFEYPVDDAAMEM